MFSTGSADRSPETNGVGPWFGAEIESGMSVIEVSRTGEDSWDKSVDIEADGNKYPKKFKLIAI
jgi:hypothetical protein